jgi:hypothetical protein
MFPHPSTLAAGNRRRRIWPVKPLSPPLTLAKGLGLEDMKTQGAVCKAKTQMNSAIKGPFVIFAVDFEIP